MDIITYIIISIFAFLQVLLTTFQQRNVAQGKSAAVLLSSFLLGFFIVFVQRHYMDDDIAAACFIVFASFGAYAGVELHKKIYKKKDKK